MKDDSLSINALASNNYLWHKSSSKMVSTLSQNWLTIFCQKVQKSYQHFLHNKTSCSKFVWETQKCQENFSTHNGYQVINRNSVLYVWSISKTTCLINFWCHSEITCSDDELSEKVINFCYSTQHMLKFNLGYLSPFECVIFSHCIIQFWINCMFFLETALKYEALNLNSSIWVLKLLLGYIQWVRVHGDTKKECTNNKAVFTGNNGLL